jgi:hypothetical protein
MRTPRDRRESPQIDLSDFSGLPLRPRQQGESANPGMKVLEMT